MSYIVKLADGAQKEILLLPGNYRSDSNFKKVADIRSGKDVSPRLGEFDDQLEKLAATALTKGGNLLLVSRIRNSKQSGLYTLTAGVFFTEQIDFLKRSMNEARSKKYADNSAYIVLYRPVYANGHNDEENFYAVLNDSIKLLMKAHTKYIIRLSREGKVVLAAGNNGVGKQVEINARFGNTYYVRGYVTYPYSGKRGIEIKDIPYNGYNPYLLSTDTIQGELESSIETNMVMHKQL